MANPLRAGSAVPLVFAFSAIGICGLLLSAPIMFKFVHGKTIEQRWAEMEKEDELARTRDAQDCLSSKTPWRCIVDMKAKDLADLIQPKGSSKKSRTSIVVAKADVSASLAFCQQEGQANCAEELVDAGYSSERVFAALEQSR